MIQARILIRKTVAPVRLSVQLVPCSLQLQAIQGEITALWDEMRRLYATQGAEIWDGMYYRLENLRDVAGGSDVLQVSTIAYSTVRSLMAYGSKRELDPRYYPFPIHTGSLILSSDGQYMFGVKRSAGQALFDLIGGGLQSAELDVQNGEDIAENMFREIHEELNLHRNSIRSSEIIGMILAEDTSVVIVFHTRTDLRFAELQQIFEERLDRDLTDIVGVPAADVSTFLQEGPGYFPILNELLFEPDEDS